MASRTTPIDIGDVARVMLVHLDAAGALETPTALTIDVRSPSGTDTQVDQDDANVTLGATWPLADRERLAARLDGIVAADLAAGTGCVQYLHTPDAAGVWKYHGKATSPSTSSAQTSVRVRAAFND